MPNSVSGGGWSGEGQGGNFQQYQGTLSLPHAFDIEWEEGDGVDSLT